MEPQQDIQSGSEYPGVRQQPSQTGIIQAVLGLISAGMAIMYVPLIFGLTGIILGYRSQEKGAKILGVITIIISALCMMAGAILSQMFTPIHVDAMVAVISKAV